MNAEKLLDYLRDESHLYSLNYHEFKSLVMEFPYCQNLRVLLVKKAQIDGQKDLERDRQLAAAYVTDRRFLYKKLKQLEVEMHQSHANLRVSENIILSEDKMELSALSDLEKLLGERHVTEVFAVPPLSEMQIEMPAFEPNLSLAPENLVDLDEKVVILVEKKADDDDVPQVFELPELTDFENPIQSYLQSFQPTVPTVSVTTEQIEMPEISEILEETEPEIENLKIENIDENPVTELEDLNLDESAAQIAETVVEDVKDDDLGLILDSLVVENLLTEDQIAQIAALENPVDLSNSIALTREVELGNYDDLFDAIFGENTSPPVSEPILEAKENEVVAEISNEDLDILGITALDSDEEVAQLQIQEIERLKKISDDEKIILEEEAKIIKNINFAAYFDDETLPESGLDYQVSEYNLTEETAEIIENQPESNVIEWELSPLASVFSDAENELAYDENEEEEDDELELPRPDSAQNLPAVTNFSAWLQNFAMTQKSAKNTAKNEENEAETPQKIKKTLPKSDLSKSAAIEKLEEMLENYAISEQQKTTEESVIDAAIAETSSTIFEPLPTDSAESEASEAVKKTMRRISSFQLESIFEEEETNDNMNFIGSAPPPVSADSESKKTVKKKKKKEQMHPLAAQSIAPDDELLSETLANVLAWQGQKDEAIKMYRKLMVKFPEKSSYFAAKIDLLEKTGD